MGGECGYATPVPKLVAKNCNLAGCPTGSEAPAASCISDPAAAIHDCAGHGTAVAGIAAGRATTSRTGITYQGIAKCAQVISYKTGLGDSVSGGFIEPTAVIAALEQAIRDRVQVVNMSFGPSAPVNPWVSAGRVSCR